MIEEEFLGRSCQPNLHALRVFLNNPITTMPATIQSHQRLSLTVNPAYNLGSLPCGYYPLAEMSEEIGEPSILVQSEAGDKDTLCVLMKNQTGRLLRNVLLTFDLGPVTE